ncbi:MAG: tRNA 2-thiouridine(34) synthase MnmA [Pseudomonadota bacterium]
MSAKTQPYIITALSGGVDSSVAALLMLQHGYRVEAMFMKNWEEDDTDSYCAAAADLADAENVCQTLGIKLHKVNFAAEYWDRVFEYFLAEYRAGRTPNPDILCNREIKFKALLDYALSLGADGIATGHYARSRQVDGKVALLTGLDKNKDQSYFLYALNQAQLQNSQFPIGEYAKPQVRKIAAENHLITHDKKDSTGICFIGEKRFKQFLQNYLPAQSGEIKTLDGKTIGKHDGMMYYTIGQRQGLGIGGLAEADDAPWYVVDKDIANNSLIVAQGHDHPSLHAYSLKCEQVHWIAGSPPNLPFAGQAKIRYRHAAQACRIEQLNDLTYQVIFKTAQRAITPGQSVVFYDNDICLGGGIIT